MHPKMFTFFKVLHWNEETPTTCESPLLQRLSSGLETHASFQVSGLSVSQLRENKTDAFFDIRHWLLKNPLLEKLNHVVKGWFWICNFFFFFFFYFFSDFFQAFFLFTLIGFVTCLEYHKLYARNAQAYGGQVYDKSLPYVPRYR